MIEDIYDMILGVSFIAWDVASDISRDKYFMGHPMGRPMGLPSYGAAYRMSHVILWHFLPDLYQGDARWIFHTTPHETRHGTSKEHLGVSYTGVIP